MLFDGGLVRLPNQQVRHRSGDVRIDHTDARDRGPRNTLVNERTDEDTQFSRLQAPTPRIDDDSWFPFVRCKAREVDSETRGRSRPGRYTGACFPASCTMPTPEADVLAKTWFYRFQLPSGAITRSYDDGALDAIHETRLRMLDAALAPIHPQGLRGLSAVDLACHQGFFSVALAQRGCASVAAIDARAEHVADCRLISRALGLDAVIKPQQADVHAVTADGFGRHDLVLCFGLIYHLENPVGALRVARSLTRSGGTCLIETQVVPNLSGPVDWGSYRFVKPLQGVFGLIDETFETHGPEMSTTGICLAPSVEGLLWVLKKVGFSEVGLVAPPDDAYEQHRYGKRVMAIARA